ncbi:hypothetical protein M404DRAFT_1006543, partial [Pisolithus tinctorius Marx 270]
MDFLRKRMRWSTELPIRKSRLRLTLVDCHAEPSQRQLKGPIPALALRVQPVSQGE